MSTSSKTDKPVDSNRGLKLVVISMGLVLIGGTILLFVLAFKKINDKVGDPAKAHIPREYRDCGEHELALGAGEEITHVEFDGVIARLVVERPDGGVAIRMVQACTGDLLSNLTIKRGK